ncbi:MAG: M56 family metallopeptidase, partial [Candidatus Latescibacterota bacterium]
PAFLPLAEELPTLPGMVFTDGTAASVSLFLKGSGFLEYFIFLIGCIYLVGFTVFLIKVAIDIYRAGKLLRACAPVKRPDILDRNEHLRMNMGISRTVELLSLDAPGMGIPACIGLFRPRIILPHIMAERWTTEECAPLLLHELAHIRRLDVLTNWTQIILQTIFFFHPLVWYVNTRIRENREEICDDMVIYHMHGERESYVRSILNTMEEWDVSIVPDLAALGLFESKGRLAERIQRMMRIDYRRHRKLTVAAVVVLVLVSVAGITLININDTQPAKTSLPDTKGQENSLIVLNDGNYVIGGVPARKHELEKTYREYIVRTGGYATMVCLQDKSLKNSPYTAFLDSVTQLVYNDTKNEMIKITHKRTMAQRWKKNKVDWFLAASGLRTLWYKMAYAL